MAIDMPVMPKFESSKKTWPVTASQTLFTIAMRRDNQTIELPLAVVAILPDTSRTKT